MVTQICVTIYIWKVLHLGSCTADILPPVWTLRLFWFMHRFRGLLYRKNSTRINVIKVPFIKRIWETVWASLMTDAIANGFKSTFAKPVTENKKIGLKCQRCACSNRTVLQQFSVTAPTELYILYSPFTMIKNKPSMETWKLTGSTYVYEMFHLWTNLHQVYNF